MQTMVVVCALAPPLTVEAGAEPGACGREYCGQDLTDGATPFMDLSLAPAYPPAFCVALSACPLPAISL